MEPSRLPPTTGVPALDQDHAALYEALDRLDRLTAVGSGEAATRACLDFLAVYTVKHFEAEEAVLRRHAYPQFSDHAAEHVALLHLVAAQRARLEQDPTSGREIAALLISHFERHIHGADMHYAAFLQGPPTR